MVSILRKLCKSIVRYRINQKLFTGIHINKPHLSQSLKIIDLFRCEALESQVFRLWEDKDDLRVVSGFDYGFQIANWVPSFQIVLVEQVNVLAG